eukprot:SAG31_NODE_38630_length_294_cov_1.830769_1_plen_53_part_01
MLSLYQPRGLTLRGPLLGVHGHVLFVDKCSDVGPKVLLVARQLLDLHAIKLNF